METDAIGLANDYVLQECAAQLAATLGGNLFNSCGDATGYSLSGDSALPDSFSSCNELACRVQVAICGANRLLEVSAAIAPTELKVPTKPPKGTSTTASSGQGGFKAKVLYVPAINTISVPPQDEESAAMLTEEAFRYAAWAATVVGTNLRSVVGDKNANGVCVVDSMRKPLELAQGVSTAEGLPTNRGESTTGLPPTYGDLLAGSLLDATLLADEAAKAAVKHHLAVADADFSRTPDPQLASKLAWTDPNMSRARAAHLLVGGPLSAGIPGCPNGMCPVKQLSAGGEEARQIIQAAAPYPGTINSSSTSSPTTAVTGGALDVQIPFEQVFETGMRDYPLRARLAERTGDDSLKTVSVERFLEDRGLVEADFVEARQYMANEMKAFARDSSVRLPAMAVASDTGTAKSTTYPIYATTSTPPTPQPAAAQTATMRQAVDGPTLSAIVDEIRGSKDSALLAPLAPYGRKGLAPLLDYSTATASFVISAPTSKQVLTGTALDTLGTIVGAQGGETEGRLETCYQYQSGKTRLRIRVYGYTDKDRLVFVKGVSELRCAVEGTVDGARCSMRYLPNVERIESIQATDGVAGMRSYIEAVVSYSQSRHLGQWLFVVYQKDNMPEYGPGSYESIGAIQILDKSSFTDDSYHCVLSPVNRDIEKLVQEILSPSTEYCGRPEHSCAGPGFSDRIPLESELSSDGDAYESSWRTYLGRAMEAANYADSLGEQLVESGLDMDRRMETAQENMEDLCGGSVNMSGFFPADMSGSVGGKCTASEEGLAGGQEGTTCGKGYVCRNGTCIRDAVATIEAMRNTDATAEKLANCIGDLSSVPYVTLGSEPVCIWVNSGGAICEEVVGVEKACPYSPEVEENPDGTKEYSCAAPAKLPKGYSVQTVTEHLDVVRQSDTHRSYDGGGMPPPCAVLRQIRQPAVSNPDPGSSLGQMELVAEVNGFFHPDRVRKYASRLGWEANIEDYSMVTLDKLPLFGTGDPFPQDWSWPGWPCAPKKTGEEAEEALGPYFYPRRDSPDSVPCVPGSVPELADSLFCSYTLGCEEITTRRDRALMNHRLGRAVLAMRILGGVGIGEGFRGPYRAHFGAMKSDVTTWEAVGSKYYYSAIAQGTATTLGDGRRVSYASSMEYKVGEREVGSDTVIPKTIPGYAVCFSERGNESNGSYYAWTDFPGPLTGKAIYRSALCGDSDYLTWPMMFKTYGSSGGDDFDTIISGIWAGLDGSPPQSGTRMKGLAKDLLMCPPGSESIDEVKIHPWQEDYSAYKNDTPGYNGVDDVEEDMDNTLFIDSRPPDDPETTKLSRYWKDDRDDYNAIPLALDGLRARDILDGMELLCEVARLDEGSTVDCGALPKAQELQDLGLLEDYLWCAADSLAKRARSEILTDVPVAAINGLNPSYKFEGEIGAAAGEFAAAVNDMRGYQSAIDSHMRMFASDVRKLRIAIKSSQIREEELLLDTLSTVTQQVANCAKGLLTAASAQSAAGSAGGSAAGSAGGSAGGVIGALKFIGAAVAACAVPVAQIGFALKRQNLGKQQVALQGELTWEDFNTKFAEHAEALEGSARELGSAATRLRAALARIEVARTKARRELSRAIMSGTDAEGREFAVNTVMRRRYNTAQVRYGRARTNAIRLAYIARRAVEQRLGVNLSTLEKDMLLVDAPARWVDTLCTAQGIDYSKLRSENGMDLDEYSDAFVGDYVRRLELVVQSYEHDYPFNDGKDRAVVSLRDDVVGARSVCETPVPNLLAYSGDLDIAIDPNQLDEGPTKQVCVTQDGCLKCQPLPGQEQESGPRKIWEMVDCEPVINTCGEIRNCIGVAAPPIAPSVVTELVGKNNVPVPVREGDEEGSGIRGFRLTFGTTVPAELVSYFAGDDANRASSLAQAVTLDSGYYRLSWYGRRNGTDGLEPGKAVSIRGMDGGSAVEQTAPCLIGTTIDCDEPQTDPLVAPDDKWHRYYLLFYVADDGTTLQVAIVAPEAQGKGESVDLGGLMLENISSILLGKPDFDASLAASYMPNPYVGTTTAGVAKSEVCEDTTGTVFRTKWKRGCMRLCATGFGQCNDGEWHCYWELPFGLTTSGIEDGKMLGMSGFAYGNYNYRLDDVTVSFVGTAVRDCENSMFPSTCYSAGSIPYTIEHLGPYEVRNHRGEIYLAPLFEGRIEHGRGLATERYISNPISSADGEMLRQFEH
ncbi:MAG: hypothetical protein V2A73_03710, partial [Pseudomonadota bacterium]